MCDMFAVPINFKVDRDQTEITNTFGGIVTIFYFIAIASYIIYQLISMYRFDQTTFLSSTNWFESSKNEPVILSEFNDSFSMIIGTKNDTLDWFNNPYISA